MDISVPIIERIHLEIIRAVEKHGSLTAAAKNLHVTQSALSHSIRKLEEQIGTEVWRRDGKRLIPTQAGQYLLKVSKRILPQLDHAEDQLKQYSRGERGTLRIGMECHPCYQWLLKFVGQYLDNWPAVDIDVKQKFQFGGIGALYNYEIDLLVTPDPLSKPGLLFEPVFAYEQVLVTASNHPLQRNDCVFPEDLRDETVIAYPVSIDRLDLYTRFLTPAGVLPRIHKEVEATDILLQMVASGRGVSALPRWLVEENAEKYAVAPVRLGVDGVHKQIYLGIRSADTDVDYLTAFINLARESVR